MAILKNLCAEKGGRCGVGDADFEEIAGTVAAFVKYNGAVLLGAAVQLLAGAFGITLGQDFILMADALAVAFQ